MNWWLNFWQDYHWWWRSFLTSGFTAVYLFGYCIHYFVSKLEIHGAASTFLYFGYTFIIVFLFFLLTGETLRSFLYSIYLHLSIQFIYIYLFNIFTFIHNACVQVKENVNWKKKNYAQNLFCILNWTKIHMFIFFFWLFSRYNWFLCLFLVCHQDLRSRQSGLKT